jgi:hypothetical protein
MSYLSKMSANIPAKARLVLVICAVVVILAFVVFFNFFGKSSSVVDQKLPGKSDVIKAPNSREIKKTEPGDQIIIPKESPISQEINDDRKASAEKAKADGGGFMDRLDFSNSKAVLDKSDAASKRTNIEGLNGIDENDESRNQIEAERRRLANEQRERLAGKASDDQRRDYQARQKDELIGVDAYIREINAELDKNDPYTGYLKSKGAGHQPVSSGYHEYSMRNRAPQDGDQGIASAKNQRQSSGNQLVDSYLSGTRTMDQLPVADLSKLESYRGGSGSKSSPLAERATSEQMAYANVVNPLSGNKSEPKITVNVGEMYYGILQIGVNTDELGPVRAILPGYGKLQGAVLVGEAVRVNEVTTIKFQNMSLDGKDLGIVAVALDPDTLRPGIVDGVDRHIFERYFKLSLAAASDGYVKALTGTTTTTYPNGSTVAIQDRLPKASDQVASAIGKIGEVLIPKFEKEFDRPPTVTVNSNRDVIIMFLNGVQL